jgi:hypothetical protein
MTEENHAISNARGWLATICEAMDAFKALEEGDAESVTLDGDTFDDLDDLRQRIEEGPLSIQVRGGWHTPGDPDGSKAEEYEILLSTGGPALRIIGELDEYCQPYGTPQLQWQDWFKPWTDYNETTTEEDESLALYVRQFYFGE